MRRLATLEAMTTCPVCDGTGFETLTDEIPCAACSGEGNLLGTTCVVCDGRGTLKSDSVVICEICKGTGEIHSDSHTKKHPGNN